MRKKQIVLFLLISALSLSLLPACGGGGSGAQTSGSSVDGETSASVPETSETEEQRTDTSELTAAPETGELDFDFLNFGPVYYIPDLTFPIVITCPEEFNNIKGKWSDVNEKARECFTDEFFENYTVIAFALGYRSTPIYDLAISVTRENGVITLNTVFYNYEGAGDAGNTQISLLILDKQDYNGEELKYSRGYRRLLRDEPGGDAVYYDWAYREDMKTLDKYLPGYTGDPEPGETPLVEPPFVSADGGLLFDSFNVHPEGRIESSFIELGADVTLIDRCGLLTSLYDDVEIGDSAMVKKCFNESFFEKYIVIAIDAYVNNYASYTEIKSITRSGGDINIVLTEHTNRRRESFNGISPPDFVYREHIMVILSRDDYNGERVNVSVEPELRELRELYSGFLAKCEADLLTIENYIP